MKSVGMPLPEFHLIWDNFEPTPEIKYNTNTCKLWHSFASEQDELNPDWLPYLGGYSGFQVTGMIELGQTLTPK